MMGSDRRTRGSRSSQESTSSAQVAQRSPGRRTRTMGLPPRQPGSAAAPLQLTRDPAISAAGARHAAATNEWMDVAMRPDLHAAPVQCMAAGSEASSNAGVARQQSPAQHHQGASRTAGAVQMAGSSQATATSSRGSIAPGSAIVVGAAADTERVFTVLNKKDPRTFGFMGFTTTLTKSLDNGSQQNFMKSLTSMFAKAPKNDSHPDLDTSLRHIAGVHMGMPEAMDNDSKLHHPTMMQYGQREPGAEGNHKKHAVLIANEKYEGLPYQAGPIAQAKSLSSKLAKQGYKCSIHSDKRAPEMSQVLNAMVANANPGDELVAFFAGHGFPDGLGGISAGSPGPRPDIFSNAQVAQLTRSATSKGVHIRFIISACHSGSAVQAVRNQRMMDLCFDHAAEDGPRVSALGEIGRHKQHLIVHCHNRKQAVTKGMDLSSLDAKADTLWLTALMSIMQFKMSRAEPPPITDYVTLGAQINYLDKVWNSIHAQIGQGLPFETES